MFLDANWPIPVSQPGSQCRKWKRNTIEEEEEHDEDNEDGVIYERASNKIWTIKRTKPFSGDRLWDFERIFS